MTIKGPLTLNNNDRYQIGNDIELTCGSMFEIEINGVWVPTTMEHDGRCIMGYYAQGLKGLNIIGKMARVKI